jgi:hypothetical protein
MNKYDTFKLESRIDDVIIDVIVNGFTWELISGNEYTFLIKNSETKIIVNIQEDNIFYYIGIQGKTRTLPFILVFDKNTANTSLYYFNGKKNVLFTDMFINESMGLLVPRTVNISIMIDKQRRETVIQETNKCLTN